MKVGLIIYLFISISGFSQCFNNQVTFIDSLGNKLEKKETHLTLKANNRTIKLEELFSLELTKKLEVNPYNSASFIVKPLEGNIQKEGNELGVNNEYCVSCQKEKVIIVDSIDINGDGIKELFLFREWLCYANPIKPEINPYGIGCQQQRYSQYEVWDVTTKTQLYEIKNQIEIGVTITTNDGRSHGYKFDVKIDKKGTFIYSNFKGSGIDIGMGSYSYSKVDQTYLKD